MEASIAHAVGLFETDLAAFDNEYLESVRTIIPYLVGAAEYGETVWSGVEGLALAAGAESS